MLISIGYSLGESREYKYFETFRELEDFIMKYLEVEPSDFNMFDVTIYRGKEEERVRKLNKSAESKSKANQESGK